MRAKPTLGVDTMKVTNIEALISLHVAAALAPRTPESLEVERYRWKLEHQARFDASPVWARGLR
jgi:hypothetical protein